VAQAEEVAESQDHLILAGMVVVAELKSRVVRLVRVPALVRNMLAAILHQILMAALVVVAGMVVVAVVILNQMTWGVVVADQAMSVEPVFLVAQP
jgi:hypothetical protein